MIPPVYPSDAVCRVRPFSLSRSRLAAVLALLLCAATGRGATLTVTTTAASGPGSLQDAIVTANASPGLDTIVFQLSGTPPFIIQPTSALPALTDPVIIDATSQPGYAGQPLIQLDGGATVGSTIGLRFSAGASTLRGLAISHFPVQAVELDGPSNILQANFIGSDTTGLIQAANGAYGVLVKSAGNVIGGINAGEGNLISGGTNANSAGIYILNQSNNVVQGNRIGTTAAGTAGFISANNGVVLYNSPWNTIGGPQPGARNLISGNGRSGIFVDGAGAVGNLIQGNFIGTDINGTSAVPNSLGDGVTVLLAGGNVICSNLISGNQMAGVSLQLATNNQICGNTIGTDLTGYHALPNGNLGVSISGGGWNWIGGTNPGAGNLISGNPQHGVALTGGTGTNWIQGNLIGLTAGGAAALGNGQDGVVINGGSGNLVGGLLVAARNIISGNGSNGVAIVAATDQGNRVQGNYLGTDVSGTRAVSNQIAGVLVTGSSNFIGGAVAGAGNVISGNGQLGVWIVGVNGSATGNTIQGNLIGLAAGGTAGLGNGATSITCAGVGISTASANLVGGTGSGAANVISANKGYGLFLVGDTAANNLVQGNVIGADPAGMTGLGNTYAGIYLEQAPANVLGGPTPGAGNLISGNFAQGVLLNDAPGNILQGNWVGTKADGFSNLANQYHNIELQAGANGNVIGGPAPGAGNRLAFASQNYSSKVYCGVRVRTGATNDLISGNSIFSNGALGIDLSPPDGGTAAGTNKIVNCESGVAANAANAGQNFPTLSKVYSGTVTQIRGNLNAAINHTYTLQFFASAAGNSSGYGEGQLYLGQTTVTLGNASCSSDFTAELPVAVPAGWVVTATATDANNNTSEFSAWVRAIPLPPLRQSSQPAPGGPGQFILTWTNNGGSFALEQASDLTPPVTWIPVSTLPVLQSNQLTTTLGQTNPNAFFRLVAP